MEIVKTKSFELAVNIKGDKDSPKVAMFLPGRLDTKDYAHFVNHVDFFAKKGYFAISFDPPGTWESPGSIELYTMTNYLKAINELINYFGKRPTVLMGHSRGGTMAMLAGPQNKHITHIIAVTSHYTPSGYRQEDVVGNTVVDYRDLPLNDTKNKKRFELPLNYFKDAEKHDIIGGLKDCYKPKLFFYGTKDKIAPSKDVKKFFELVPEPKVIHEINSEHDYRLNKEIIDEVSDMVWKFLNKYN